MKADRLRPGVPPLGTIVADPPYAEWPAMMEANRRASASWAFEIGGRPFAEFRKEARAESVRLARGYSAVIEIPLAEKPEDSPVIMTGHQPELYHPGVWLKDFLLQRFAAEYDALGMDVVVDSDGFERISLSAPCIEPVVHRCEFPLADGSESGCFAGTKVPEAARLSAAFDAEEAALAKLADPAVVRNLDVFRSCMESVRGMADSIADLVTYSRRRLEARAGNDYLELPVTALATARTWHEFVAELALDARRFATAYNDALGEFRELNGTKNPAQPFPDLSIDGDEIELPLWSISEGVRTPVVVMTGAAGLVLMADGEPLLRLGDSVRTAARVLAETDILIAPKAVALTLFDRLFLSDLFIHGTGGGRYDAVTDGVMSRYFGIEPPGFVVASASLALPVVAEGVSDEDIARAKDRLNRLQHNPDALLGEVDFEDASIRQQAEQCAAEKARLVIEISRPDADKKALGRRIREVNEELASLLEPLRIESARQVAELEEARRRAQVLCDRSYPFCLWDPEEFAATVDRFAGGATSAL